MSWDTMFLSSNGLAAGIFPHPNLENNTSHSKKQKQLACTPKGVSENWIYHLVI